MIPVKNPLRVLVVDDTVVYRKIVSDVLTELPYVEVVGTANNGKAALQKIKILKPDLLTLDIEMPELNGLQVLQELQHSAPEVGAVMVSTLTHEGGVMTIRALELGAFDFIPKPTGATIAENRHAVKIALAPILAAFHRKLQFKNGRAASAPGTQRPSKHDARRFFIQSAPALRKRTADSCIIAIGVSTGGPMALARMLPELPADIGIPILVVQHMPALFTQSLAKSLDAKCALSIKEAQDGEPIRPNHVYIAPGGRQMKVAADSDRQQRMIRITDDPPENNCKPSADYLFRSIADHYAARATGVIMTGMGADGNLGLKYMKRNGAVIIAQDESSCVVFGMPREPIESGTADIVVPLERMAAHILQTIAGEAKSKAQRPSQADG